jgi:hypothetical protein
VAIHHQLVAAITAALSRATAFKVMLPFFSFRKPNQTESGTMSQTPLFLETDEEPDDILALLIWAARSYALRYVVVGEGNIERKVARMQRYLEFLRQQGLVSAECKVVAGRGDDKNQTKFAAEGAEFGALPVADMTHVEHDYVACLKDFVAHGGDHFACMKPPRELCANFEAVRELLGQMQGFFYGSFNLRNILFKDNKFSEEQRALLVRVLSAFKRTVIYETFPALGLDNTMTTASCPKTWALIEGRKNSSPYLATLRNFVRAWNSHIKNEGRDKCLELLGMKSEQGQERPPCLEPFVPLGKPEIAARLKEQGFKEDPERFWRAFRVYREYLDEKLVDTSIVLADVGLAACAENPIFDRFLVAGRVDFDPSNGYTLVLPSADSAHPGTVAIYRDPNFPKPTGVLLPLLDEAISRILA